MQDLVAHLTAHGSGRLHEVLRRHRWCEHTVFNECFLAARLQLPPVARGAVPPEQAGASEMWPNTPVAGSLGAPVLGQGPLKPSQAQSIAVLAHAYQLRAYSLDGSGAIQDPVTFAESVKLRRSILAHLVAEASSLWSTFSLENFFGLVVDVVNASTDDTLKVCIKIRLAELNARQRREVGPDGLTRAELEISRATAVSIKARPTNASASPGPSAPPAEF